jgi:hypothetical protein
MSGEELPAPRRGRRRGTPPGGRVLLSMDVFARGVDLRAELERTRAAQTQVIEQNASGELAAALVWGVKAVDATDAGVGLRLNGVDELLEVIEQRMQAVEAELRALGIDPGARPA